MIDVRIGTNDTGWGGAIRRRLPFPDNAGWMDRYLDEAAQAGFEAVELSPGMLADFGGSVPTLTDALARRGLTLSGAVVAAHLEDANAWSALEQQTRLAATAMMPFGAQHLILIDMLHLDGAPPPLAEHEWQQLIATTDRLADLADDLGLVLAIHPHVDSQIETEAQIDRLLTETNPARVTLCLDTGQLAYLDIDPVAFIRRHHHRISYLHLKNINPAIREQHRQHRLPWVQAVQHGVSADLTDGVVDFHRLKDVLNEINYTGWAIVELDRWPSPTDEPYRTARKAREHLRQVGLG